jgi:hypothetical protein
MVKGRQMADRLKMDYDDFIEAQADGLQQIKPDIFPTPQQLHTSAAEVRATTWAKGGTLDPSDLRIDEQYLWGLEDVKRGTADLKTTRYVAARQRKARGKVSAPVQAHLQKLNQRR